MSFIRYYQELRYPKYIRVASFFLIRCLATRSQTLPENAALKLHALSPSPVFAPGTDVLPCQSLQDTPSACSMLLWFLNLIESCRRNF